MPLKLVKVSNLNTKTQIKTITFDRAYDYLCTNKNMAKEDEELLKKIEEAKEKFLEGLKENLKQQKIK